MYLPKCISNCLEHNEKTISLVGITQLKWRKASDSNQNKRGFSWNTNPKWGNLSTVCFSFKQSPQKWNAINPSTKRDVQFHLFLLKSTWKAILTLMRRMKTSISKWKRHWTRTTTTKNPSGIDWIIKSSTAR